MRIVTVWIMVIAEYVRRRTQFGDGRTRQYAR